MGRFTLTTFKKLLTQGVATSSELTILAGSNRSGKSFYAQSFKEWNKRNQVKFKKISEAIVDGEQWYTVSIGNDLLPWLNTHPANRYYIHPGTRYITTIVDLHYSLYTIGLIKWS